MAEQDILKEAKQSIADGAQMFHRSVVQALITRLEAAEGKKEGQNRPATSEELNEAARRGARELDPAPSGPPVTERIPKRGGGT